MISLACRALAMEQRQYNDPTGLKCPKCGSHDIRPSRVDGFVDSLLRALGRFPFRCRSCRSKFHKASLGPPAEDELT